MKNAYLNKNFTHIFNIFYYQAMTSENSLRSILHHWLNYPSKKLLLDFRPFHKHYACRIIPSVCIPFTDLKKHLFELPPKSLPFAVLEPHDNAGIAQKLLKDQGWNVPWIFTEGEELWEVSRELGILEETDGI